MASKAKRTARIVGIIAAVLVVAAAWCLFSGHYEPDDTALAALESDATVSVEQTDDAVVFEGPDTDPENTYGLVFYPGAKVDERAYAPLLHQLAAQGWLCVDAKMPLDFAFFNANAARVAMAQYPQVEHWYIGGHSLGGAMAANFAAADADELDGVVLLAAYSTKDLSGTSLTAVSAYGSDDGVLNRSHYEDDRANLPAAAFELVIDGGNHAQFGSYGAQAGDNTAEISPAEQVSQTVLFIQEATRG